MSKKQTHKISDVTHHISDATHHIGHNLVMHLHHDYDLVRREFSHLTHLAHFNGVGHSLSGSLGNVRHDLMLGSAAVLLLTVLSHNPAMAVPDLSGVYQGSAQVSTAYQYKNDGTPAVLTTTINQTSQSANLQWQNFNVAAGQAVQFNVPNGGATLNVVSSKMTVSGSVTSNGTLYFSSPQGMVFDATSRVTANNFYATTQAIDPNRPMTTADSFTSLANPASGGITLAGDMNIAGTLMVKAGEVQVGGWGPANTISARDANISAYSGIWVFQAKLNAQTADQSGGTVTLSTLKGDVYIDGGANINASAQAANKSGGKITAVAQGGTIVSAGVLKVAGTTGDMAANGGTVALAAAGDIHVNLNDHIGAKDVKIMAQGNVVLNGGGNFDTLRVVAGLDLRFGDWSNVQVTTADLTSEKGKVYQIDSSAFSAESLTVHAAKGISLNSGGNQILSLGAMSTTSGDIIVNSSTELDINNSITNDGSIKLTAASLFFKNNSSLTGYSGVTLSGSTINTPAGGEITINSGAGAFEFNGSFTNVVSFSLISQNNITVDFSKYNGIESLQFTSKTGSVNVFGSNSDRFTAVKITAAKGITQTGGSLLLVDDFTINSVAGFTFNLSLSTGVKNLNLNSTSGGVHLIGGLVKGKGMTLASPHVNRLVINAVGLVDQDLSSAITTDFLAVFTSGGINLSSSENHIGTISGLVNSTTGNVSVYSAEMAVNIGGTYNNTAANGSLTLGALTGGVFNITSDVFMMAAHININSNIEGGATAGHGFTIYTNDFNLKNGDNGPGKFRNNSFNWNASSGEINVDASQFKVGVMNLTGYKSVTIGNSVAQAPDGNGEASSYISDLYLRTGAYVNGATNNPTLNLYNVSNIQYR